jgi:hypothetical protein
VRGWASISLRSQKCAKGFCGQTFGRRAVSGERTRRPELWLRTPDHVRACAVAPAPSLHFGSELADADSVQRLVARLLREDVQTGELFDSEERVAFHCVDPDGYPVEVSWKSDSSRQ